MKKNRKKESGNRRRKLHIMDQRTRELAAKFAAEEDAISVLEIVLIIVVLISLVIIFKEQLTKLVKNILDKITSQSNSV